MSNGKQLSVQKYVICIFKDRSISKVQGEVLHGIINGQKFLAVIKL